MRVAISHTLAITAGIICGFFYPLLTFAMLLFAMAVAILEKEYR